MNRIILLGRLTKDPEITVKDDKSLCKFSIAVNRDYQKDKADFINVVCFGKTADNCHKYLAKGSQLAVEGRLQIDSYEKDDKINYYTSVVAEKVTFLGSKAEKTETAEVIEDDGEIPF